MCQNGLDNSHCLKVTNVVSAEEKGVEYHHLPLNRKSSVCSSLHILIDPEFLLGDLKEMTLERARKKWLKFQT